MTRVITLHMGQAPENPSGCEIYRGHMPMHFLKINGWVAHWHYFENLWAEAQIDRSVWERLLQYDVFVFPRMYVNNEAALLGISDLLALLRQAGKAIVYEVDDDFTNMDRKVIDGDAIAIAKQADAITVTTPHLRKIMQKVTGRPAYVLPNSLDPGLWQGPRIEMKMPPSLRIGLTGSITHERDWKVLMRVVPQIKRDFPDVQFVVGGFLPDYIDPDLVTFVPPMPYGHYAHVIKNMDIVLAPVNNDLFNMGKSPIKVVEGMGAARVLDDNLAGAAVIASDHPVYQLAIQHGRTGLLVKHEPDAWYEAIAQTIEDAALRHRLQREGYSWAWTKHDMSKNWRMWAKAYRKIISSSRRKTA